MIDSPILDNLKFLYEIAITSKDHSFIRFHGRNPKHRYNHRYSIEVLPWIDKVKEIAAKTNTLSIISCKELIFKNYFGDYKRSNICNKFTK
jgi:uncharacterized protein YecE (DUF72 family)